MSSSEADPGRLLANRYRLDEVIGAGGMGRVWRGTDTLLDRPVAVKELTTPPNLPDHEVDVLRTRMVREARNAAQLSHPSIITVFDVAEEDGRPWIVMELIQGPSLGDLARTEGALPVERVAAIGEQVAAGLAEAHARGIVHRDIKPGNVLIAGNDRAVVTDFGIAHLDGSTHLTSTGLLIGSPSYLAPEIAHGRSATSASDMWALGITLYQAVENSLPFDRPTPMATLTAIVTNDLPEGVNAGPLQPVLAELCAKRPEDRPSIGEVRRRLRGIRDGGGTAVAGPTAPPPAEQTLVDGRPAAGAEHTAHTASAEHSGETARTGSEATQETAPPQVSAGTSIPAPPRHTRGDAARTRRRNLVVVAAAFAVLVVAATVTVVMSMSQSGPEETGLAGGAEEQTEDDSADQEDGGPDEGAAAEEEDEQAGEDEDEWDSLVRYEDSSGFSVDVPEDWEEETDGHMVYFHNPDGGYLLVDQTDDPNDDAGDDWRDFEPTARDNFSGYSLIGIEDVEDDWADDYVSAADWEFTFDGDDGPMHGINRGFHTEDTGYALFLVASADHQGVNSALLDRVSESFEPA